jgi:hypothetical protein
MPHRNTSPNPSDGQSIIARLNHLLLPQHSFLSKTSKNAHSPPLTVCCNSNTGETALTVALPVRVALQQADREQHHPAPSLVEG